MLAGRSVAVQGWSVHFAASSLKTVSCFATAAVAWRVPAVDDLRHVLSNYTCSTCVSFLCGLQEADAWRSKYQLQLQCREVAESALQEILGEQQQQLR
jgi:hypothetical protein